MRLIQSLVQTGGGYPMHGIVLLPLPSSSHYGHHDVEPKWSVSMQHFSIFARCFSGIALPFEPCAKLVELSSASCFLTAQSSSKATRPPGTLSPHVGVFQAVVLCMGKSDLSALDEPLSLCSLYGAAVSTEQLRV